MADIKDTENARIVVSRAARNAREFISYSDGTSYTHKLDSATGQPTSDWNPVEPPVDEGSPSELPTRYLGVVAEHQAENEPKHWCLFSHVPNAMGTGPGQLEIAEAHGRMGNMWQVIGDAESMHFESADGVDKMSSPDFAWHQVLKKDLIDGQLAGVNEIARSEKPPSAPNRAAVTEHCQGWTVRVVKRLVEEGIVEERIVGVLEGCMDSVRNA